MAYHSSATVREHTPHSTRTSRTNTIVNALKRRAQAVLNDTSIDPKSRAIIRYAMEINDPWLARLVRRADAGEAIVDTLDFEETFETNHDSNEEKIEAVTERIRLSQRPLGMASAIASAGFCALPHPLQTPSRRTGAPRPGPLGIPRNPR